METDKKIIKKIRIWIAVFMLFLVLSGVTAFPIETEMTWLVNHSSFLPEVLQSWLSRIYYAVKTTNANYPQLAYGTDWLAFSHIVIATAFIGPLMNPIKNVWVIQFGMIACVMVFPLAFIAGHVREIPVYWRLIDCSFGVIGLVPLIIITKLKNRMNKI